MDTVSFVFQNSKLIKASILENVKMGKPDATNAEVTAALKAAQCMDIIEKNSDGVNTVIGSSGVYLSGGEQQRISNRPGNTEKCPHYHFRRSNSLCRSGQRS